MQNLVYENYSKFIRATDTIRDMRSHVQSVASQLSSLDSTLSATVEESSRIHETLSGQRENIEELHGVRSLLSRLQSVFNLPDRLSACLQQGAFEVAADEYEHSVNFLDSFSDGALDDVKQQTENVVAKIAASLRMDLKRPEISSSSASSCIMLLERFRQPTDRLREEYIKTQSHKLSRILKDARSSASTPHSTNERESVRDLAVRLDQNFLMEFAGVVSSYNRLFEHALILRCSVSFCSRDERKACVCGCRDRETLIDSAKSLFNNYFAIVAECFTPSAADMPSARDLVSGLSRIASDNCAPCVE
jgi:uncharacterized protein (DUF1810 family)